MKQSPQNHSIHLECILKTEMSNSHILGKSFVIALYLNTRPELITCALKCKSLLKVCGLILPNYKCISLIWKGTVHQYHAIAACMETQ